MHVCIQTGFESSSSELCQKTYGVYLTLFRLRPATTTNGTDIGKFEERGINRSFDLPSREKFDEWHKKDPHRWRNLNPPNFNVIYDKPSKF